MPNNVEGSDRGLIYCFPSRLFLSDFQINIIYELLTFLIRYICSIHLILFHLIILVIRVYTEQYMQLHVTYVIPPTSCCCHSHAF
jgi:hypothetical protein